MVFSHKCGLNTRYVLSTVYDIQGRLFELALKNGYDCPKFIRIFMNSRTADVETIAAC